MHALLCWLQCISSAGNKALAGYCFPNNISRRGSTCQELGKNLLLARCVECVCVCVDCNMFLCAASNLESEQLFFGSFSGQL